MNKQLVSTVAQRAGLPEDKAQSAVEAVVNFLKERAPAGLSGQIDSLLGSGEGGGGGGSSVGDVASRVGGMLGKKE